MIPGLTPVNDYSGSSRTTTNKITFSSLTESDFGTYGCIAYFDDFSSVLTAEGAELTELSNKNISQYQLHLIHAHVNVTVWV